jgi:Lipase (class 3)
MILPDRSYRTTCSLYATSSLTLPEWAHRPGTPDWLTQRSSWIGYVAVCDSEREIARMGRRDITIVLRGTATCHEWFENLRASLTPLEEGQEGGEKQEGGKASHVPKVARGFLSLYKSASEEVKSLSSSVIEEVKRLMEVYKGEELSITVVGHSLGAALALLVADEVSECAAHVPPIAVVSFGGPKVGNRAFAERLQSRGVKVLRVVNEGDVITRVPGIVIPRRGRVKEGYEHVGVELRVDSRTSPCIRSDAGLACSHDLEAYLHLVDGFTGTGQPFRPDARRSIARLLQHQRTNVKEVYVSRARALGVDPTAAVLNRAESFGCVPSPSYR